MSRMRAINTVLFTVALACCSAAVGDELAQAGSCMQPPSGTAQLQRLAKLVCIRISAIETAFGMLFEGRTNDLHIEFMHRDEARYPQPSMSAYDPAKHTLYFSASLVTPPDIWFRWARTYWPYYREDLARQEYPILGIIDEAVWNAHLYQAAHSRGVSWPSEDCGALEIARRLGCEMLLSAIAQLTQAPTLPLFNANRIDRLWPESLQEFERRVWTRHGREYREVRRLGGLLLIEPLIREFGAPRVFAYVAGTPFRIENDNVHLSALRYQNRARAALAL